MVSRPAHPYPVLLQTIFGLSFIIFLIFGDKIVALGHGNKTPLWIWSAVQIMLGVLLIRRRSQAKRRVYRCIRCG